MGTVELGTAGIGEPAPANLRQAGMRAPRCPSGDFLFSREVGKERILFFHVQVSIFKHWQRIQMFLDVLCGPNKISL